MSKVVELPPDINKSFRMQLWDTAGQEKYKALTPMYYRDAVGAIIVYDITSTPSFEAVKSWIKNL